MVADMTDERDLGAQPRRPRPARRSTPPTRRRPSTHGQPTVILAKTIKGYGMGEAGEGQNITHQQKKMNETALLAFRDRFELELTDEQVQRRRVLQARRRTRAEMAYLRERRAALGGALPRAPADGRAAAGAGAAALRGASSTAPASARSRPRWRSCAMLAALAARQAARPARRPDRPRRVAHVRHGGDVPPARDLQPGRPALPARGPRPADVLPRGQEGPDPPGGHQRGRARSRRGSPPARRTPTTACR